MKAAARTHVGRIRPINEDSYLLTDHLALVADGMGGHQAGEVASALAVETMKKLSESVKKREISIKSAVSWVRQANTAIYEKAKENPKCEGMGTTLTALFFMKNHALLSHVGDSRCYRIRDHEIQQLSSDHSLVAELIRRGDITKEHAKIHPYRNVITRALGTDPTVAVDVQDIDTLPGDLFLLCSDGLSNYIEDEEFIEICDGKDLEEAADKLLDNALTRGGRDNITLLLISLEEVTK